MTLSIAQLAAVLILGISSFLAGWMLRRIQAKGREAQLQKHLTDANTAIPSLETNLRNRDQRIASLFTELTEWKAKIPTLEAAAKRKEVEVLAKDRELRVARVEIDALKQTVAATPVPDPAKLQELETMRGALRDAQTRSAELTAAIAERDARLAAPVPSFIALPVAPATESEGELHARIAMLESGVAARDGQIAELHKHVAAERETAQTARADLEGRAAEIDRMRAEDAKWQTRVPKLVATIKARDTALGERDAALVTRDAELAERAAELARRDQSIAAAQAELDQQRASNASLSASLHDGEARIADLSSQLATMSQQLDAAAANHAAKLATALRLGREELDNHHATLERLQTEHDAQSSRSHALEAELAALQAQLGNLTQTAADETRRHADAEAVLRGQLVESEQRSARSTELSREQHVAQQQQLERTVRQQAQLERQLEQQAAVATEQRAKLEQSNAEQRAHFERRLAEADALVAAVEQRLSDASERASRAEQRLSAEQQQHGEAAANVASLQQSCAELEAQLATAEESRAAFESQIETLRYEHGETEQRMREAEREASERVAQDTEEQTIELVELREEVRTLHTRVAPLESLLKQRDSALFERGERIEAMTTQIQALVAQNESLQATLRQRGEKIALLERKFSDQPPPPVAASDSADRRGDHLEQRLVAQIERNRELTKIVEERDRDIAAAAKANDLNGKSMLILKQQLDDARATEERLAVQVRELKSASQRAPEPDNNAARSPMSKPNGLFELPPEHVDELQQIRGIGDGFERGLNKLGIYQFSQLAGLSAEEIVWIEAHLPTFHGRIERDDWPGQAAALMAASEHAEWSLRAQNAPSMSPRIN